MNQPPDAEFERIAKSISSDESPVGIDAKKTHVLILQALARIEARLERLEKRLDKADLSEHS